MRKWIASVVLFSLPVAAVSAAPLVTMSVDEVPVAQVLQALATLEKKNIVIPPEVSGVVSLNLTEVPWLQAMQTVAASAGLILSQQGAIWQVHTASWQQQKLAEREAAQARRKKNAPTLTRGIVLRHANAAELAKAAEKLISAQGTITVDTRLNRLLVRDNKESLAALETGSRRWICPLSRSNWRPGSSLLMKKACVSLA